MKPLVVQVADCQISNDPDGSLVTYALGSCIAVTIHDDDAGVGGMLHLMLPESGIDRAKAQSNPYMFADTGIPLLFRNAYECGAEKRRLTVRLAGGAQVMDENGVFNIGKRNYLAVRKILWKAGVLVSAEDVGQSFADCAARGGQRKILAADSGRSRAGDAGCPRGLERSNRWHIA